MPWMKIKAASFYAGVSPRTVRTWLKEGLTHSRLPSGTILIKNTWIDDFIEGFAEQENKVNEVVDSIIGELEKD